MEDTVRELQAQITTLTQRLEQVGVPPAQGTREVKGVRTFKGRVFEGDGKLVVEEFLYQLENHFAINEITENKKKTLVLVSRVGGAAGTWVRQWRETHQEGFGELVKALKERFEDKLKSQKTYNKLLNMRQGKRLVRDFNREFNKVLLEL